jgi:erythromycin esterase
MIRDARIVAIGEATHGTSEFHLLRHRLVQYLVEHLDFRLIGIEAGWPECLDLNRYIVDGEGDPAAALASNGFWIWDVREFRAFIDWLRRYNQNRDRDQRVHLFGFDAITGRTATDIIWNLLDRVDPDHSRATNSLRQDLSKLNPWLPPREEEEPEAMSTALADLAHHISTHEDRYRPLVSDEEWQNAFQAIAILNQVDIRRRSEEGVVHFNLRDRDMAANMAWRLDQSPPGTKAVLLAHNGHVTRDSRGMFDPSVVTMGQCLAKQFGDDYLSVGMMFGQGSFQAIVDINTGDPRLDEVSVDAPPAGSLDAALMEATTAAALLLDTRDLPPALRAWLEGPLVTREAGAGFDGEPETHSTIHPAGRHDLLAFVRHTTRANPTPTGMRPPW